MRPPEMTKAARRRALLASIGDAALAAEGEVEPTIALESVSNLALTYETAGPGEIGDAVIRITKD